MKKAQMEIMGLAVIIILLALGLLFVVRFVILNEPSQLRQTFTRTQLSANLLNTVLKTSTSCSDNTISDLLKDCATQPLQRVCPNGETSCEFVDNALDIIFNETLTKYGNQSYNFITTLDTTIKVQKKSGDCSGVRDTESQPLPSSAGDLRVRLEICA